MNEYLKTKLTIYAFLILGVFFTVFTFQFFWNDFANFVESKKVLSLPKIPQRDFVLGLDLKGGVSLLYETDLTNIPQTNWIQSVEGARDVVGRRVNFFGFTEAQVSSTKSGDAYRILVEIPGKINLDQAKSLVGETPVLDFREERDPAETTKIQADIKAGKSTEDPYFKTTDLNGRMLKRAQIAFSSTSYSPEVEIQFNSEGQKIFADLTKKNLNKKIAVYLDGVPITVPTVKDIITDGTAVISGSFTVNEAKQLATRLNAGALPVPIKLISSQQIGSILGELDLGKTLKAGALGILILALFFILYYRLLGFIAIISLLIYGVIVLFLFKYLPVTLTLSGLAGFIISIGIAVDANVLIFERIKEELLAGKDMYMSSDEGTKRAWLAIRDSNLAILMIMIILYSLGTGFVKGFSFTLSLGIIASILTNYYLTRTLLLGISQTKISGLKILFLPFYIFKQPK